MTEKEKAEAYVRSKCPELMELSFGCLVEVDGDGIDTVAWLSQKEGEQVLVHAVGDGEGVPMSWINRHCEIIGHPIRLNDWLRVLETLEVEIGYYKHIDYGVGTLTFTLTEGHPLINKIVTFNLTAGQPATEADYQAFNQIVGI